MAQRGCPPEQALRHLHDASTHLGVGLPAVAERLVRSVCDRGSATSTPSTVVESDAPARTVRMPVD